MLIKNIAIVITWLAFQGAAMSAVSYYEINEYVGYENNPFFNNVSVGAVYLEDFQAQSSLASNVLTTPFATGWNGAAVGAPGRGVQADILPDNAKRGMGWVWSDQVSAEGWRKPPTGIHFDFTPDELGRLPEYCGAALLGRIDQFDVGGLYNNIFVYDKDGNEVTGGFWRLPRPLFSEEKLEDQFKIFAGIHVTGGISSIQFRDFVEVDHLTYGYAPIPEPATISLASGSALLYLRRRRRPAT